MRRRGEALIVDIEGCIEIGKSVAAIFAGKILVAPDAHLFSSGACYFFVRLVDALLRKREVAFDVCGKGRGTMLISVVEDNPAVLSMIETALALHGHNVETYSNSTSFLWALQKSKRIPPYDLVLVDLFLENQSGTDLIEALQVHSRYATGPGPQIIPTILISAAEENILAPIRQRYPNLPILRKPFKMQELISLISKVTSS